MAGKDEFICRPIRYRIGLQAPRDPNLYVHYYDKFKSLLNYTYKFALQVCDSAPPSGVSRFDIDIQFVQFLRKRQDVDKVSFDILFPLHCGCFNKFNIESRMLQLKRLNIKSIYIVADEISSKVKGAHKNGIYFKGFRELIEHIQNNYSRYFQNIALISQAKNPNNFKDLLERINLKKVNTMITSNLVLPDNLSAFKNMKVDTRRNQKVQVVPSVTLFSDHHTLASMNPEWELQAAFNSLDEEFGKLSSYSYLVDLTKTAISTRLNQSFKMREEICILIDPKEEFGLAIQILQALDKFIGSEVKVRIDKQGLYHRKIW